ncbi:MAG: DNA translocase FtsK [Chloroflexia bacterium]|nr:DNA translocase FtsK [Chloroflexia bacterium]
MAAQTRSRTEPARSKGKQGKNQAAKKTSWFRVWIGRFRAFLHGLIPTISVSPRLRREMIGMALVLLALVSSWALGRGAQDGALVSWWANALRAALGEAAILAPILFSLTALRALASHEGPILLVRHIVGGMLLVSATVGLLSFGGQNVSGALGMVIGDVARGGLGRFASGLVLFVAGVISVFLLADTDLMALERDVRRLMPRRKPRSKPTAKEQAPAPKPRGGGTRHLSTAPSVTAYRPVERVINIPKREVKAAAESQPGPMTPPVLTSGEPLPLPDIRLLPYYDEVKPNTVELEAKARAIEERLLSFKVEATVREINPGPAVTQFALEPGNGVKVRRITELQNDLALALAAPSIRVEAPIPGMARVGLEIPNAEVAMVGLREVLEAPAFARSKAKLPLPLGRDVNGRYIVGDLAKMPHLLIAGATGAGKSICLNGIISTFLLKCRPDEVRLLMIDPKMVELTGFNGVPHLQCPVVTEMDKVVGALRMVLREMNRRYELFKTLGVRNIDGYRLRVVDEPEAEKIPYLVVIIDELADLMMTTPDDVETLLARLTQMARATGIHLIIATQRPSVNVLTGLIKANVPARIAFAVSSMIDSRVVLDMPGAERLLGRGDMLYLPPDAAKPLRVQGAFIDEDVKGVVDHWHTVAPIPQYAPEWLDLPSSDPEAGAEAVDEGDDPLMIQALDVVRQQGTASASMLQRRLRIGYNRAARLIEQMEDDGVIGPADGVRGRTVIRDDG